MILNEIKNTLKCGAGFKNSIEALLEFDFKVKQPRASFMRLCFSPLASWYVYICFLFFYFSPLRYKFSLLNFISADNVISQTLFLNHLWGLIFISVLIIFFQWKIKVEELLIIFLGFLISNGDIHVALCLILLALVKAVRIIYQIHLAKNLLSLTKVIYSFYAILSIVAFSVSTYIVFSGYRWLFELGFFNFSVFQNRFEYFILACIVYNLLELFIISFWGHFYNKKINKIEDIKLYYSSFYILKEKMISNSFKNEILKIVGTKLVEQSHIVKSDLDLIPKRIVEMHKKEERFLKQAQSILN